MRDDPEQISIIRDRMVEICSSAKRQSASDGDQGFCQSKKFLRYMTGIIEQVSELAAIQQPDRLNALNSIIQARALAAQAQWYARQDTGTGRLRQPMEERGNKMWLDREPKIGCLHIVTSGESLHLVRELAHVLPITEMFNHRVRMNDVERIVFQPIDATDIAGTKVKQITVPRHLRNPIDQQDAVDMPRQEFGIINVLFQ